MRELCDLSEQLKLQIKGKNIGHTLYVIDENENLPYGLTIHSTKDPEMLETGVDDFPSIGLPAQEIYGAYSIFCFLFFCLH